MFGNALDTYAPFAGDASRDLLTAMENWVEKGIAPSKLIATQFSNNDYKTGSVVRTRPICAYPKVPQYIGSGDPNVESSFTCEAAD